MEGITSTDYTVLRGDSSWIILPRNLSFEEPGYLKAAEAGAYTFYIRSGESLSNGNKKYYFGSVFGKSIPEIRFGYYTSVSFNENKIIVSNDQTGVGKFFYSSGLVKGASSDLKLLLKYTGASVKKENALLLLLFNYPVFGRTLYNEVRYSEPGSMLELSSEGIKETGELLHDGTRNQPGGKKEIKSLSEILCMITSEAANEYTRTDLTLTGGYDSRLVLAALLAAEIRPAVYTFGDPGSADCLTAREVSRKMGLVHRAVPFEYINPLQLEEQLTEITRTSGGLLNPFRIIRLRALQKISDPSGLLLLGYGGSEILRGIFPEGLLVSDFYANFVKTGDLSVNAIKKFTGKFNLIADEDLLKRTSQILEENRHQLGQYNYMIKVILPMHFGEDIRYLMHTGLNCYSPFMDARFIQGSLDLGLLPLWFDQAEADLKDSRLKRIDNPRVSARMMLYLNRELSGYNLNRGYAPADYIFSKYYAGLKLLVTRYSGGKKNPVTKLNPWLNDFFRSTGLQPGNPLDFDEKLLAKKLEEENPVTEYDFLPWTKLWILNKSVYFSFPGR